MPTTLAKPAIAVQSIRHNRTKHAVLPKIFMTELLERAIKQLKSFDEDKQNAIASLIIEELESEAQWDTKFANSQDLLADLAAEAMSEHRAGQTQEMPENRI